MIDDVSFTVAGQVVGDGLFDPRGKTLRYVCRQEQAVSKGTLAVSALGTFAITLEDKAQQVGKPMTPLLISQVEGRVAVARADGFRRRARGEHHVGRVTLSEAPLVVAGVVKSRRGQGIDRYTLRVSSTSKAFLPEALTTVKQSGGRFRVFGRPPPGPLAAVVVAPGHLPSGRVTFQPGRSDLSVSLSPAGSLRARVRGRGGSTVADVRATVLRTDRGSAAVVNPTERRSENGVVIFAWANLPEGRYSMMFWNGSDRQSELHRVQSSHDFVVARPLPAIIGR